MQKQRIVEVEHVEDNTIAFSAPRAQPELRRPELRLANENDVAVVGPARKLQDDLAQALTAESGWTVKRTVIVGVIFHAVILGSLALAASNLIPHLAQ
jgi:hypothetical protein